MITAGGPGVAKCLILWRRDPESNRARRICNANFALSDGRLPVYRQHHRSVFPLPRTAPNYATLPSSFCFGRTHMNPTLIDAAFKGLALIVVVYVMIVCFRIIGALFTWARQHSLRSIGRASGRAAGASRELAEGFKEGFSKRD